jgi:hypothetical protein
MALDSSLDVEYLQGIHVVDSILWLDAPRLADLCFVSHAQQKFTGPHRKILLSEKTAALLGDLGKTRALISPFYRRFSIGGLDLELSPSGYMLGAAQLCVTRDNHRLVYTGDFLLDPSHTTESARVIETDALVMKATCIGHEQTTPPRAEVEQEIVDWARRQLESNLRPVLFTMEAGQSQELVAILGEAGLGVRAHRTICALSKKYVSLGVQMTPPRRYTPNAGLGDVILYPWRLRRSRAIAKLERARTALVGGRAVIEQAKIGSEVDVIFGLCEQADYRALVRYAQESGAGKIYLLGPGAGELAEEFRRMGMKAWTLRPPVQAELFSSR